MSKIERSNDAGRFSEQEIRAKVAEHRAYAGTPQGKRELRARAAYSARAAERTRGFTYAPELAGGTGIAPVRDNYLKAFDLIR